MISLHRRWLRRLEAPRWLLGVAVALTVVGCGDFLSGPGLSDDPSNITNLTRPGPLYSAIQQRAAGINEIGLPVRYMQQMAGIARQAATNDAYGVEPVETDALLADIYTGSGLLDLRKVQQLARGLGDSLYVGIAKVYEAMNIGGAAAIWGDIPYREAADSLNPTPKYDPQLQVYADLQTQLDSAIDVFLVAAGPSNGGSASDGAELVYAGRGADQLRVVYSAVARSLKARFFLHVAAASRAGVSGAPPAPYDSALKYATFGIATPDDDLLWFHSVEPGLVYGWWAASFSGDIAPGAAVIEILKRRIAAGVEDSQRLAFYFTPASDGEYRGFRPSGAVVSAAPGIDNGSGPYSGPGAFMDPGVSDGSFRSPGITYAEMQLIAAEATWQINCTGCVPGTVVPAAQPFLDNARRGRRFGATAEGPVDFGDAPGVLPASLVNIIEEKYVALFLNPEVWNDWKRTCLPSLAPSRSAAAIAGRLPYGASDINANPNVPSTSSTGVTVTGVSLNPNQPRACPALNYTSSSPLAN